MPNRARRRRARGTGRSRRASALPASLPPSALLSSWSQARSCCKQLISEMAPLRSSRCSDFADPVGEVAPCWPRRRFSFASLAKRCPAPAVSPTSRGDNAPAMQVLASREMLEHIADFVSGIPSLVVDFVKKNDSNTSLVATLSPFHDDESEQDEHWSACYDPQAANGLVTRVALEKDNRRVLRMLLRLHHSPVYRRQRKLRLDMVVVWCVELGRLQTMQWLYAQLPAHIVASLRSSAANKTRLLNAAARNGDVAMLQWIQQHCGDSQCCKISPDAIQSTPQESLCQVVQWLYSATLHSLKEDDEAECFCGDVFSAPLVNQLAQRGCLEAIQFLYTNLPTSVFQATTMDAVAGAGHLEIVAFLHSVVRLESCSTSAMDTAAQNGHLSVVQFLHSHRHEGCTTAAMDGAAANGHLDIVQFLHTHRHEGCTVAAMDEASRNGHRSVVQFLNEHRSEKCTRAAMDQAALLGHLDVVQYLHQSPAATSLCSPTAMDNAALAGHVDIVRFLHEHRSEGCTTNAMDLAAQNGHLAVVTFLHQHRSEGCTRAAMNLAAQHGHVDIVQFLHTHREEGCTKRALSLAARNGFTPVVKFLVEHRREGCAEDALRSAYRSGRFEVARYLHQRGFMGNVSRCVVSCCCPAVLQYS